MKNLLLTLSLTVFAFSMSFASTPFISEGNNVTTVSYDLEKDSCDKDCKKACCAADAAETTKKKKACTKGKKCCKAKPAKAEASASANKAEVANAKPAKKACCSSKKKCEKAVAKPTEAPATPSN